MRGNIPLRLIDYNQIINQRRDKEFNQLFRREYGTNQNFIARPCNTHIDSAGHQNKPLPQTFNQVIAPTQLEHIDERRNFGQHRKLGVSVSGSIRNQNFSERALSVPNN